MTTPLHSSTPSPRMAGHIDSEAKHRSAQHEL
eukprot:CAMPEP_0180667324 /NCGR_PEP_ID=MMETSP1037_2-20121125/62317_1 /TAXON_ID=632150 /ORGANISM="Azadinium spinosum, Strain 3D9" /LENGTH=31 /DNA_ID= /DNA_START= /DNA_END= /DNA_ORIENTATION=